jgi:hypothetical protein
MLNILLGAGFGQGLRLPGTAALTEHVRQMQEFTVLSDDRLPASLAPVLWKIASAYYDEPTFETLLHLIESMLSAQGSRLGFTRQDAAKVAFNAFMDITPRLTSIVSASDLPRLGVGMMSSIADYLDDALKNSSIGKQGTIRKFLSPFLEKGRVRISTLNYDDSIERSMTNSNLWDGFTNGSPGMIDYKGFRITHDLELLHLHGSVRFVPEKQQDSPGWFPHLKRFDSNELARSERSVSNEYVQTAQSGEVILTGPIISGLRKSDKLVVEPYGLFHQRFQEGLAKWPRFLCIGYGAADTYLNAAIRRARALHGRKFRAVYVNCLGAAELNPLALWRALYLPAMHCITWSHEFQDFLEGIKVKGNTRQQNEMLFLGTGFPLAPTDTARVLEFLYN